MKKLLISTVLLALFLAACGNKNEDTKTVDDASTSEVDNNATEEAAVEEATEPVESEYPYPSNATPLGDAKITVSTPAGDSADGNVPVLFVSEDDILIQIGIDYENFDGSKETFVYINEIYYGSEQVGELTQTSLDLSEDTLKPGDYTVTAVQFTDNDPTKEPINLTQTQFKIEKSS